ESVEFDEFLMDGKDFDPEIELKSIESTTSNKLIKSYPLRELDIEILQRRMIVVEELKQFGISKTISNNIYLGNFDIDDRFGTMSTYANNEFTAKLNTINNRIELTLETTNEEYSEKFQFDMTKFPSEEALQQELKRKIKSYIERTRFKIESPEPEPSKLSYKGVYKIRYGIEQTESLDSPSHKDQLLIITQDGRVDTISSNLISKQYSIPELNNEDTAVSFLRHEITHAISSGLFYQGFKRLIDKHKPKTDYRFTSTDTYSILGEGIIAHLTDLFMGTRFFASSTNFNYTLLLTQVFVDEVMLELNKIDPEAKQRIINQFQHLSQELEDKYLERKKFIASIQNQSKDNINQTNSNISVDIDFAKSINNKTQQEAKEKFQDSNQNQVTQSLQEKPSNTILPSDIDINFDFSDSNLFEAVNNIDINTLTQKLFLKVSHNLLLAKLKWEGDRKDDPMLGIFKTSDSNSNGITRSVEGDVIDNFLIWYSVLSEEEKSIFTDWLVNVELESYQDDEEKQTKIELYSRFFTNLDLDSLSKSKQYLITVDYSQNFKDLGGPPIIF
ncbi:MAG: hypothetical protein ACRCXZ_00645, partial [Patescibacteria group bacterium]